MWAMAGADASALLAVGRLGAGTRPDSSFWAPPSSGVRSWIGSWHFCDVIKLYPSSL